ncbi:hypothetical protein AO441_000313, partial [Nakaseomyces glabratus]
IVTHVTTKDSLGHTFVLSSTYLTYDRVDDGAVFYSPSVSVSSNSVLHTSGLCSMATLHREVPTLFPLLLQDWSWRCSKHATVVCRHAFLQSLVFVRYW